MDYLFNTPKNRDRNKVVSKLPLHLIDVKKLLDSEIKNEKYFLEYCYEVPVLLSNMS